MIIDKKTAEKNKEMRSHFAGIMASVKMYNALKDIGNRREELIENIVREASDFAGFLEENKNASSIEFKAFLR